MSGPPAQRAKRASLKIVLTILSQFTILLETILPKTISTLLAPAVTAGKGVKGERECRHCLRFQSSLSRSLTLRASLLLRPPLALLVSAFALSSLLRLHRSHSLAISADTVAPLRGARLSLEKFSPAFSMQNTLADKTEISYN